MSDLTEGGKALVQAARVADRPSDADRERVLVALQARLGDAALLGAGAGEAASAPNGASVARSKLLKWGWVGPTMLVAGAAWFAPHLGQHSQKPAPATSASTQSSASAAS